MEDIPTCVDDILNIRDIQTARKLIIHWKIPSKGIAKQEDAIRLLLKYWSSNENESSDTMSTNGLQDAILLDEKNREKLCQMYDKCLNFYGKLPTQHQADLDGVFQNLVQMIERKTNELKTRECTILVAGETGAGKSSFINLLLGTSILPTANLPCTSTICEIRTCPDVGKSAVLTYKLTEDGEHMTPKVLDLHTATGLKQLADCIQETDEYFGESPYEKIEINWPFSILQSFGFIYLVNSSAAGGIQKGRLKDFLRTVVNSAEDDFSPSSTMFVCNKWETVPDSDKNEVKSNTFDKLGRIFPGVREDQIYYMSVQQFNGLLSQVLKRSMYSLKVAKIMDAKSMKSNQDMISDLYKRMERLVVNSRQCIEDLHKGLAFENESLYKNVTSILRDTDFIQKIVTWQSTDCPQPDDWKNIAREASERIASRIALEINIWERTNGIMYSMKEKIVKKFKQDFALMEDQIKSIEGALLGGNTRVIADLHKSMKRQHPLKKLFQKARHADYEEDSFKGLGGAVVSVGEFDIQDKNVKKLFSGYKKQNSQDKMSEATQMFVFNILSGKNLKEKVKKYIGKFVKGIDNVAKMIPEFIKADRQLIQTLEKEVKDTEGNLKDVYPDLLYHCKRLQSKLDLFFVHRILQTDFRVRDLKWNDEDVCRDPIKEATVTDILLEDRTMRELEHENIVKYYGSTCRQGNENRVEWIMITELLDGNLKDLVIGNGSFQNPGKCEIVTTQTTRMVEMAHYVLQICRGVECLHSKELVHLDLKCENILVSKGVLKLSDFGLTKSESEITGTYKGSPLYMAPEVLLQSGLYDRRADIYSLAIVLWEIWYGAGAEDDVKLRIDFYGDFQSFVKNGNRPSLTKKVKPPEDWIKLIKQCWENEADRRPEIITIITFFEDFIRTSK
ncbi:hypothetical protein KUTeg_020893 [Tegillarca granosa]|uniref:Protein kinase domain-containing protein n=1 Tax=Tegillarca granosa TaxID=220873 RepID=A0ABQ9EBW8_TEGGR|nr:hypothetical protein KUTeg_020893 [Tegillarca granosa]